MASNSLVFNTYFPLCVPGFLSYHIDCIYNEMASLQFMYTYGL